MASTSTISSSSALTRRFAGLAAESRKALVCYMTAGHPDQASSVDLMRALESGGADIIEVGVPFSDPIADGPAIQASSQVALANGTTLHRTLELVTNAQLAIPVVLFSYLNPLLSGGDDILDEAAQSGVHGVLVTDLPVGADPERERWLGGAGLDFVRLVAPTTPEVRMREITENGTGFVYLISRLGVTGTHATFSADIPDVVSRLRRATDLPVCVGFGISTPDQAREIAPIADGIVVGSAVVTAAGRSIGTAEKLVASMRKALDE